MSVTLRMEKAVESGNGYWVAKRKVCMTLGDSTQG